MVSKIPDDTLLSPQEFINMSISILTQGESSDAIDTSVFSIEESKINQLKLLKLIIDDTCTENHKIPLSRI